MGRFYVVNLEGDIPEGTPVKLRDEVVGRVVKRIVPGTITVEITNPGFDPAKMDAVIEIPKQG